MKNIKNIKLTKTSLYEIAIPSRRGEGRVARCIFRTNGKPTKTEARQYLIDRWGILADLKDITLRKVW
jgi:hypothetical protein